jgi:DNA topoisomerase-1
VSDEAMAAAEEFIYENYGKEYLPGSRPSGALPVKKGANVQDAHEAIRPTDLKITPKEARKSLDKELADLYELIWSRFVASQMAAAIFDQTTVEIEGGAFLFRATGRITRFKGWMQVYDDVDEESEGKGERGRVGERESGRKEKKSVKGGDEGGEGETILPENIRKGAQLRLEKIETKQSFTKPPLRYTESLLVKEMEAKGIGRPSTYASIISTIQDRGYVEQRERKLHATELGMRVCDALVDGFPALFDVKFTAKMEGELDTIAGGRSSYLAVMQAFYKPLQAALRLANGPGGPALAEGAPRAAKARRIEKPKGRKSDVVCAKCGSAMELRAGNYGPYLACLGFPACRNIIPANEDGTPRPKGAIGAGAPATPSGNGTPARTTSRGEKGATHAELRGATGGATSGATGETAEGAAAQPAERCDKCGSPMVKRKGKSGGEFYGCSNYPNCTATKPVPLGVTCPGCGQGSIVERVGGRFKNVFYACTRYPDCRFTSSLKPANTPCARCGNTWMVHAWKEGEGEFLECVKCRGKEG